MKISKDLRLTMPVQTSRGQAYLYALAPSREIFDQFFVVIAKAFSRVYTDHTAFAGPRIAAKYLRKVAAEMSLGAPPSVKTIKDEVEDGFFGELRRLSMIVAPSASGGYEPIPLEEAISKGLLDEEETDEVENALVFFTLSWLMLKRNVREAILNHDLPLWDGQLTSLDYTAFANSLRTSTETANSGEKAPV